MKSRGNMRVLTWRTQREIQYYLNFTIVVENDSTTQNVLLIIYFVHTCNKDMNLYDLYFPLKIGLTFLINK